MVKGLELLGESAAEMAESLLRLIFLAASLEEDDDVLVKSHRESETRPVESAIGFLLRCAGVLGTEEEEKVLEQVIENKSERCQGECRRYS